MRTQKMLMWKEEEEVGNSNNNSNHSMENKIDVEKNAIIKS